VAIPIKDLKVATNIINNFKNSTLDSLNLIAKKVTNPPVSESNMLSEIKDKNLILNLQA
jgi:hypothetical protein